jgi:uncharacterized cupin superfamily protein
MNVAMISTFSTSAALRAAPINPDWILEGNPTARNRVLARSSDSLACSIIWDCTAGKFNWFYDIDETVHIIEGSVTVSDGQSPPKTLKVGDVAFFPAGTKAHWHVENYVRKVAFCQRPLPKFMNGPIAMLRALKAKLRGGAPGGSLMDSGPETA